MVMRSSRRCAIRLLLERASEHARFQRSGSTQGNEAYGRSINLSVVGTLPASSRRDLTDIGIECGTKERQEKTLERDPVCGMNVEAGKAAA